MIRFVLLCHITFLTFTSCKAQERFRDISDVKAGRFLWIYTSKPWSGTFDYVKELIKKGADVNFVHPHETPQQTPFLNAVGALDCLEGKDKRRPGELDSMEMEAVKIVKYLKRKGANVHALTTTKKNGLHLAARGGRAKMIPVLVHMGLDINKRDSTLLQTTPLVLGIGVGSLPTVKALVESGADINLCIVRGNSPLDWAVGCASGNTENYPYHDQQAIVEYLISKGAKHGKNDFTNWMQF